MSVRGDPVDSPPRVGRGSRCLTLDWCAPFDRLRTNGSEAPLSRGTVAAFVFLAAAAGATGVAANFATSTHWGCGAVGVVDRLHGAFLGGGCGRLAAAATLGRLLGE